MSSLKICKGPKGDRIRVVIQWDFLKSIFRHTSLPMNPTLLVTGPKAPLSFTLTSLLVFLTYNIHPFSYFLRISDVLLSQLTTFFLFYPHKFKLRVFSCFFTNYLYPPSLPPPQKKKKKKIQRLKAKKMTCVVIADFGSVLGCLQQPSEMGYHYPLSFPTGKMMDLQ